MKSSLTTFLDKLGSDLDERIAEANAEVSQRRQALSLAESDLQMLMAIKQVKSGDFQLTAPEPTPIRKPSSGRAPRAEGKAIQEKIKELLGKNPDGKPVSELIQQIGGDQQKIRNQLATMVKKNEVARHSSGLYSLPI